MFQLCRNRPHWSGPSAPSTETLALGGTRPQGTLSGGWQLWHGGQPICRTRPSGPPWDTPTLTSSTLEQGSSKFTFVNCKFTIVKYTCGAFIRLPIEVAQMVALPCLPTLVVSISYYAVTWSTLVDGSKIILLKLDIFSILLIKHILMFDIYLPYIIIQIQKDFKNYFPILFAIFNRSNRVRMISPTIPGKKNEKLCFSFW